MKRLLSTTFLAFGLLAVTALVAPATFAERGSSRPEKSVNSTVAEIKNETESETENETETEHGVTSVQEKVEQKRSVLEAKIGELRSEGKTKLDSKRKNVCEKRESAINSIIDRRSQQATKNKEVFSSIYIKVTDFAERKNLNVENYDALVAAVEEKKAGVEAAIEANDATTFDCDTEDGDKPGKIAQNNSQVIRDALQEYRTAIKNLIVAVKTAAGSDKDSEVTQ